MNFVGIGRRGPSQLAGQPAWQENIEAWREALKRCGRRPGRKRVHAMRVTTVRLQAPVEVWLQEQTMDDAAGRAARHWMKQAEKLRKILSPVRDLDVLLQILRGMRSPQAGEIAELCRAGRACLREMDTLERRLERKRASAEKRFSAMIAKKQNAFDEAGVGLAKLFCGAEVSRSIDTTAAILGIMGGLELEASMLTAETLHEFRKRAKTARYLAEISQSSDAMAKAQAALLKKIQNKVGIWHDWLTLAEIAESELGAGGGDGLVPLLRSLEERSLEKALGESRRLAGELGRLGEGDEGKLQRVPRKRPVQGIGRSMSASKRRA
ncbi:MAG TPA: CHAD domain-containing protein [Terracidiphilus sp.]|jgi:CHAD domain-containing protein|nr:CHAD domain-containing protein [Terracidiphilus sp.]